MANIENSISICLFFTYPLSLENWYELGLFDREVPLYKKFADSGIKIAFFTYGDDRDFEFKEKLSGIEIIPAYAGKKRPKNKVAEYLNSLVLPFRFRKILSAYSIMKTNQMMGAWVPLAVSWLTGKSLIARCGFEFYNNCRKKGISFYKRMAAFLLSKTVYNFCRYIIITSHHERRFISRTFRIPLEKITVIPNFINTDIFAPNLSNRYHEDRVVYVGRIHKEKNLQNLIKACANSDTGLDIIGSAANKSRLEAFAHALGADVRFLGVVHNRKVAEILGRYRVFILPSYYEGNPKSLLEAMSCEKAVIGTDVVGIREIIRNGKNGLLCNTDAGSLADAIERLISNKELCKKLGKAAREYILGTCGLEMIVDRELSIYKRMLENGKIR